jgi:hypothetical protein
MAALQNTEWAICKMLNGFWSTGNPSGLSWRVKNLAHLFRSPPITWVQRFAIVRKSSGKADLLRPKG